jgi:ABC-type multidrug transport system ATPase subunit
MSVIHQPRSSIFSMFDELLLISEGRLIYYGPAADAVSYFESASYPCPKLFNPGEIAQQHNQHCGHRPNMNSGFLLGRALYGLSHH